MKKLQQAPSKSNDSLMAIALAAFGTILSLSIVGAKIIFKVDSEEVDSTLIPIIFGTSIVILSYVYRIWIRLGEIYKTGEDMSKDVRHISGSSVAQSKEYHILSTVSDYDLIAKNASEKLLMRYYNNITASSSQISIDTRDLAVYFNTKLWEELTEFQRYNPSSQIDVNITHSVSIDFWERDDAVSSLEQQAKFIDAGGKITRIIQGPFSRSKIEDKNNVSDTEIKKYHKIMSNMSRYKIDVFYVEKNPYAWPYDFLWAKMKEKSEHPDLAMLWYADQSLISACKFIIDNEESDDMRDVKNKWDGLNRKLREHIE